MPEYIYTNLPQYVKVNSRTEFSSSVVSSGAVLLFSENGSSLTAKLPDGSFVDVGGGSGGTDVSSTTAEAGDVLSGKIFFTSGGVMTSGTIPIVSASLSANVTTVPAGYIAASQTLTVPLASSATVAGGIVTIPAGYVASDYTVSAGGGSATDFFRCASVTSGGSAWTGYKAVLSSGQYEYESTVTSGLFYGSGFTPEVGKIYNDGALIKANLYEGIPVNGLVFYAPLAQAEPAAETGQTLLTLGTITYQSVAGIPCCLSTTQDGIGLNELMADFDPGVPKTMSCWVRISAWPWSEAFFFCFLDAGGTTLHIMTDHSITLMRRSGENSYEDISFGSPGLDTWLHLLAVDTGDTVTTYLNGTLVRSAAVSSYSKSAASTKVGITCADLGSGFGQYNLQGYMAAVRMYNRALSAGEIAALANEFTPSA